MDEKYFDLYLYTVPESNKLVKIPHLLWTEAKKYGVEWCNMNELHDYILVIEGSTPWSDPIPEIIVKDYDWMIEEFNKLSNA